MKERMKKPQTRSPGLKIAPKIKALLARTGGFSSTSVPHCTELTATDKNTQSPMFSQRERSYPRSDNKIKV